MKPRARRVTIGAVVLGAMLVVVLLVANWSTVRDHVEAWWFQLTHRTAIMIAGGRCDYGPRPAWLQRNHSKAERLSFALAASSARPVIFDPAQDTYEPWDADYDPMPDKTGLIVPLGYRVLEQRFPRRAYVVIRAEDRVSAETFVIPGYGGTERP